MASVNKPTRKPLTLSVKLDIIYKLQNGYSNARIFREYALSTSTVSSIWSKREKYLGAQTQTNPNVKKYGNQKGKRHGEKVSGNTIANCFRHAGLIAETEFTEEDELPLARLQEEGRDLTQWDQSNNISDFDDTDLRQYELIDENLEVAEYPDYLHIVQPIMNPPKDEDSNEDEPEEEVEISTAKEAMIALKTVMSYVECKYPEKEQFLNAADQLEQDINIEILSSRNKQNKITDFFQ
ncbi:hypothetical protein NQ318_002437 [Aromia moschata]|uniref:HTH psq-type domain-containing protein n=1 Tax=Aromia moschata TaxID=1265417 RepID=A0AAV8YG40_9CUCU|nr:hypothetical protein NQ318_002437 [Aromia moschata]